MIREKDCPKEWDFSVDKGRAGSYTEGDNRQYEIAQHTEAHRQSANRINCRTGKSQEGQFGIETRRIFLAFFVFESDPSRSDVKRLEERNENEQRPYDLNRKSMNS